MRRSIRRTLLSWYALILIAMIGAFGGLLYVHRHRTSYDGVDAELTAHGLALAACAEWEPEEGYDMEEAGIYVNRFETDGPTTGYAGVWDEEGRALVRSSGAPERVEISPPGIRVIGDSREIVLAGPKGSTVRIGLGTASLLRESVEFLTPLAGDHGVSVALETEDVRIRGDRDRIRDAVGNLISNAIRYNRDGGRVDISLSRLHGQAVLAVTDTGIGIAADEVDRVFERFYRVDVARSREVGGSGLGLAIARWIVEAHGGAVSIESEAGVGTTAMVRLPIDA